MKGGEAAPAGGSGLYKQGRAAIDDLAVDTPGVCPLAPSGYLKISSGLGEAPPAQVIVLPVLFEGTVLGVIELASFTPFTQIQKDFLNQIAEMIGTSVNTISVNTKTEVLLKQSQELTEQLRERSAELENRQKALQASNAELEEKSERLARQNRDIEVKNTEIEEARQVLEERAEQLAVSMLSLIHI